MAEYKRIRALFCDHLGLARGKYIPTPLAAHGARHSVALFALGYDRTMTPAPGTMMLEGMPDCDLGFEMAHVRPSWEADTGVVVGDLSFRGAPLPFAPRHVLKRAVNAWTQLGYTVKVGIELEAYILQPTAQGGWSEWQTPGAYVYGTGPFVDPIGLFDEIMNAAEHSQLPIESINSEYDTPQFELTLEYGDAVPTLDNIFLFKLLARELAARRGLLLTFLGKPFAERSGNGFHVNFSLQDARGNNVMHDAQSDDGLSLLARQCIAGLIEHHEGMAALCAQTVNAYKRLRPGQMSGYWANWGYDHRGTTVRVPHERGHATRLEHRMGDGAANPYLATAAVLQAARLGVTQNLTPPPFEAQDCIDHQSTNRHTPNDLSSALDALEADDALCDAVGRDLIAQFVPVKRAEFAKFAAAVTDWERNYYLPFL